MEKKVFDKTKYTIAAFDVDGTLICHGKQIRPVVQETLIALRDSGISTVVATGRDELQMPPDLMRCFSYAVTANGGCVSEVSTRRLLAGHPFSKELLLETIRTLEGMTGECILFRRGNMMGSPKALEMLFRKYPPGTRSIIPPKTGPLPGRPLPFPWIRGLAWYSPLPVYKLKCYFRDLSFLQEAYEKMNADSRLTTVLADEDDLEITVAGISKASGLDELCRHLGCTLENVAAFGDSGNDYEMLKAAGFSVVMGNAEACVLPLADYLAPSVYEDGAAAAVCDLYGIRKKA